MEFGRNVEGSVFDAVDVLLREWNCSDLIEDFKSKGIDLEVIKQLTVEDINLLIPIQKFGLRVRFRMKLFEWRNANGFATPLAETVANSLFTESLFSEKDSNCSNAFFSEEGGTNSSIPLDDSISHDFQLNLKNLLRSSMSGRIILETNEKAKVISKSDRRQIVSCICEFWLKSGARIGKTHYEEAIKEILKNFPTESEVPYKNLPGKRGKLAEKYYGLNKKYQKKNLVKSRYRLKSTLSETSTTSIDSRTTENEVSNGEITDDFMWLKHNYEPEQIAISKWENTFALRRNYVTDKSRNILADWPILKHAIGSTLIELDFERTHPGRSSKLFSKWECFCENIINIYKREIKDKGNKKLLSALDDNLLEDVKNYVVFKLIPAILPPQTIKRGKENKKIQWKPSILDSQNALLCHIQEKSELESFLQKKRSACISSGRTIQPFIVVVGTEIKSISDFFAYYDNVLFPAKTFLKALSLTFQLHQALNIEYAEESRQVWLLLEKYIYELPYSSAPSNDLVVLNTELSRDQ